MGPKNTSACVSLRLALAIHRDICADPDCEASMNWQAVLERLAEVLDVYAETSLHGRKNKATLALEQTQELLSRLASAHGEKATAEQGRD
jgi:hypothetical protein